MTGYYKNHHAGIGWDARDRNFSNILHRGRDKTYDYLPAKYTCGTEMISGETNKPVSPGGFYSEVFSLRHLIIPKNNIDDIESLELLLNHYEGKRVTIPSRIIKLLSSVEDYEDSKIITFGGGLLEMNAHLKDDSLLSKDVFYDEKIFYLPYLYSKYGYDAKIVLRSKKNVLF